MSFEIRIVQRYYYRFWAMLVAVCTTPFILIDAIETVLLLSYKIDRNCIVEGGANRTMWCLK